MGARSDLTNSGDGIPGAGLDNQPYADGARQVEVPTMSSTPRNTHTPNTHTKVKG